MAREHLVVVVNNYKQAKCRKTRMMRFFEHFFKFRL